MFSVIFPGQGSQAVGMGKEFYDKYQIVKEFFLKADDVLNYKLSDLILNGPKEELNLTANTQPAIFLVSYSIYNVLKKEHNIDLDKAQFFAGHSLGEYSALACAGYLKFEDTLKILRLRGESMQNAVPKGVGGMVAILGTDINNIEKILNQNFKNFQVEIANDNSDGQIVVSGKTQDLIKLTDLLKKNKIKNVTLPVSAPFHCSLMKKATENMRKNIRELNVNDVKKEIISNVTAKKVSDPNEIKDLLIEQIEKRVRWRETIINIINEEGINEFIEIGPGKVLAGLIKRINKDVRTVSINSEIDIKDITIKTLI